MSGSAVDEARLETFMGQLVGYMTGATACMGIWIGDELGLYRAMAGSGPVGVDDVAARAGCHPRLVREWLDGQAAAGLVTHHDTDDTYELPAENAMALADEDSAVFVARGMNTLGAMFMDVEKVKGAFRGDGGIAWGDHHPCLFSGTEWFFRTGYRAHLASEWLPSLDGVIEKLETGASVADVGCGHGASIVVMAEAFPASRFTGVDYHEPSIVTARERVTEAGVDARVEFQVADARSYDGTYDLICFFDCLHDMGDPVGAARHARDHLADDGTVLLVEPFAIDGRSANIADNPVAALMYTASATICVPNSLSQDVGLGLGAQAGEQRLGRIFADAGFSRFRLAMQTPLNLVLEARP